VIRAVASGRGAAVALPAVRMGTASMSPQRITIAAWNLPRDLVTYSLCVTDDS